MRSILILVACLTVLSQYAHSQQCYPPCRTGFICHDSTCVSRCNPPCPDGQQCSNDGECVAHIESRANPVSSAKAVTDCAPLYIVRPPVIGVKGPLAKMSESDLENASYKIADAVKSKYPKASVIASEDRPSLDNCSSQLIVLNISAYYTEPAKMGQYVGHITVTVDFYTKPTDQAPARGLETSAVGGRHWGDSVPFANAVESICTRIRMRCCN
jgi:hypothetical protein